MEIPWSWTVSPQFGFPAATRSARMRLPEKGRKDHDERFPSPYGTKSVWSHSWGEISRVNQVQCEGYRKGYELLDLPALDLPEPESVDDDAEDVLLAVVESDVEAAGLLLPEPDLLSDAAAEMSALPSDLLVESDDVAGLVPDLA